MACRQTYVQKQLGRIAPPGLKPGKKIRFDVLFGVEDGRVALRFEQAGCRGQDYIAIEEDSVVEIALRGDQIFFSKEMEAITTKDELTAFYGGLEYDGYDEKLDRYRIVRFAARYNRGGKKDTTHSFNLNVDFLQQFCDTGPRWIPLTIDPDIKNPPPMIGHR